MPLSVSGLGKALLLSMNLLPSLLNGMERSPLQPVNERVCVSVCMPRSEAGLQQLHIADTAKAHRGRPANLIIHASLVPTLGSDR